VKRTLNEIETFRAQELLLQRATEGLDEPEAQELAALGADEDHSFDLAASAVDIATLKVEEMPIGVADKILIAAGVEASRTTVMPAMAMSTLAGYVPPRTITTGSTIPPNVQSPQQQGGPVVGVVVPVVEQQQQLPPTPVAARFVERPPAPVIPIQSRKRSTSYAWIAAAASIVLAAGAVLWATQREPEVITKERIVEVPVQPPPTKEPTAAEARAELLASATDVTTLAWTPTKDPNGAGTRGDVVWSASAQRGYMRFVGLAPNDLKQLQYQLWIFDKDRDQAYPVDGGVFDVSSTGEVIVPISARLRVNEQVLFAVTIEQPGGVVVSKRERIVVTAAPAG
jgi:hypothetical protein